MGSRTLAPDEGKRQPRKRVHEGHEIEPAEEGVQAAKSAVFTFRLPREELAAIEKAAADANVSMAEYLRRAASVRPTASVLERPQYSVLLVTPYVVTPYYQPATAMTWSEGVPTDVEVTQEYRQTFVEN